MKKELSLPPILFFLLSIGYFLFSSVLLLEKGTIGAFSIFLGIILFFCSLDFPRQSTYALFFLIPALGFIDNQSIQAQGIPFLWGPFFGWCMSLTYSEWISNQRIKIPRFLILLWTVVFLTSLWGIIRYVRMVWPNLREPIISGYEKWAGNSSLIHVGGWMVWGAIVFTAGFWFFIILNGSVIQKEGIKKKSLIQAVLWGLVPAFLLGSYQIIFNTNFLNSFSFFDSGRINGTFADPNAFAMSLALLIPFVISSKFTFGQVHPKWTLFLKYGFLFTSIIFLFFTGTRSSLLSLIAGGGIGFLCVFRRIRFQKDLVKPLLLVMGLLFLVIAFFTVTKKAPLLNRINLPVLSAQITEMKNSPGGRVRIWQRAWLIIKKHSYVVPSGLGSYLTEAKKLDDPNDIYTQNDNAGNYYLQLWVEMGPVGLLCVIILFLYTGRRSIQRLQDHLDFFHGGSVVALWGMFFALFVGSHILHFSVSLIMWLIITLVWDKETV